jgi:hypothetical protein
VRDAIARFAAQKLFQQIEQNAGQLSWLCAMTVCPLWQPNPESNPRPHGGSNGGLGGCVIFGGGVGEPANRQGAALFNQGIDLLHHGIASKTVSGVRLELARRGWQ